MASVEESVKRQFAKVFEPADWALFKKIAEAHLQEAAFLKKSDMRFEASFKLLCRNIRKRLLIGVGVELLLKAVYLKMGYCINKPKQGRRPAQFPLKWADARDVPLDASETYTLGRTIDCLPKLLPDGNRNELLRGLNIAKVFRNKEGHTVTATHAFDESNYRDIECSLMLLYEKTFDEVLSVCFSMTDNDVATWRVRCVDTHAATRRS